MGWRLGSGVSRRTVKAATTAAAQEALAPSFGLDDSPDLVALALCAPGARALPCAQSQQRQRR